MIKKKGYTLLEVLVALTVFAILSTITASAMYNAFNTRAHVNSQTDQLNTLQLAITLITRDIEQVVERAIIDRDMRSFPPFVGESHQVEFTRGGAVNPSSIERRSTLKRIAYLCVGKKLLRRSWDSLDTPNRKRYQDKILLDNLDQCSFAYVSNSRQVLTEWQAYAVQDQKKETLPIAVQFNLSLAKWGEASLLFIIPEALYAPPS